MAQTYTAAELKALERRDGKTMDHLKIQLDRIEALAVSSDRALRGHNGDAGLVANVEKVTSGWADCHRAVEEMKQLLHGDPKDADAVSMVMEQRNIRTWVAEVKKSIKNIRWWVFVTVAGMFVEIIFGPAIRAFISGS